jgi:formate--tetrahydrofolate ligase
MPTSDVWKEKLGLQKNEVIPMGMLYRFDSMKIIDPLKDKTDKKYIEVPDITPTPLDEGKSTTSVGLIEGLGKCVGGALDSHPVGPIMNIKRGHGRWPGKCIPLTEFSLGLADGINGIINVHNLAMVALFDRV